MDRRTVRSWTLTAAGAVLFAVLIANMDWWEAILGKLFPDQMDLLYPRATLMEFTVEHLALVGVASLLIVGIGVPIGIELLGAEWSEPTRFRLAYAFEQATNIRRPPAATPPLDTSTR